MNCFMQLIATVKYLHHRRMVHCDIKPENVLLGLDPVDNSVVYKLADFGLSRDESASVSTLSMTSSSFFVGGTRFYMSPERLLPPFTASYASDVWSLALVFLEVASGRPVSDFFNANGRLLPVNIEQLCPLEYRDVLLPCFEDDIKKRLCDIKQLEKAMLSRMFDVFISYRVSTESGFALALYEKLKQKNLRVFLDQSCTGIPLGVEWGPYFFRALSCSTLVVPLISEAGVLAQWTKDTSGQHPVINRADNVLIEHQAALGFYQLYMSGRSSSEMRVKCVLPLFLGSPSSYDEMKFSLVNDLPDEVSVRTQASGKELCLKTDMLFAQSFFDKTVKR
jgi:serine/threonine protein kinase